MLSYYKQHKGLFQLTVQGYSQAIIVGKAMETGAGDVAPAVKTEDVAQRLLALGSPPPSSLSRIPLLREWPHQQ